MSKHFQAIRGMKDILPAHTPLWQHLEDTVRGIADAYGYREIRLPLLEHTEVFARSIGEVTDIVEKEMYTFDDRSGDSLTLRPEGTAGCVRAAIENGMVHNQVQRLWYLGPMFRHERPQKGRYRQFHQFGVEAFGLPGPDVDAEVIVMCARLWRMLGLTDVRLELNSIGTPASRAAYRRELIDYFSSHRDALDEDSRRRLERNPLRILDSKNPAMAEVIAGAPPLDDALDAECRRHFETLQALLTAAGIEYRVNPRLVRGLDYYTRTVFEWITDELGAQGTICAGGRYDGLVEQFGGRPTPAVGFAMGLERLVEMLELHAPAALPGGEPDLYVIPVEDAQQGEAMALAESLRDAHPRLRVLVHCGGGSLKSQFRRADRSGAVLAVVLGESELAAGTVTVKHLHGDAGQHSLDRATLIRTLPQLLATGASPAT